jgi:beta-N-acetylhexosaminidase
MPAHVVYPHNDELPAGFSAIWLQQILRSELGFDGAIFSDDLSMEGAASVGGFHERAGLAQQAGCDMLLVCNNPTAAEQMLDCIAIKRDGNRERRLQNMRSQGKTDRGQLLKSNEWQQVAKQINQFNETHA